MDGPEARGLRGTTASDGVDGVGGIYGVGSPSVVGPYFQTRLRADPNREKAWRHLCAWLARYIPADRAVLDLGAGWCHFANHVRAARVVAMDLDGTVVLAAAPHVRAEVGDCTDLSRFEDGSFDVVFASNLLEHLDRDQARRLLGEAHRVLRPGGRLILLQPNFRLDPGRYFDDYTHVSVYTDQSLGDYLGSLGWRVEQVRARFLPLSLRTRGAGMSFLLPVYLRSPIKPCAGQMLVVASRGDR
ncbi:MAG: class I SAM-dependent methyltransferase [Terracoccus sp.]